MNRLDDLVTCEGGGARQTGDLVLPLDLKRSFLIEGDGGADPDLGLLSGPRADHQPIFLADIAGDGFIELEPAKPHCVCHHDAAHGHDGRLRHPAPQDDDQVARRGGDGQSHADGCCQRLLNKHRFTAAGLQGGLVDGSRFHTGHLERDRDHHPRLEEPGRTAHLLDKKAQHAHGDFKIRNHPFAQRAHHLDDLGYAPVHIPGSLADFDDF